MHMLFLKKCLSVLFARPRRRTRESIWTLYLDFEQLFSTQLHSSDHPHFLPSLYFWPSHLHGRQTLVDFTHSFVRLREYMPHVRQYPYVSRIPVGYNFMWISAYSLETEQPFEYSCSWMECWYEHVCGPIPLRTSRGYFLQTLGNHTQAGWQLSDCYTHIVKIP